MNVFSNILLYLRAYALLKAYLTELWITDAEIIANLRRLLFRGEHLPCDKPSTVAAKTLSNGGVDSTQNTEDIFKPL